MGWSHRTSPGTTRGGVATLEEGRVCHLSPTPQAQASPLGGRVSNSLPERHAWAAPLWEESGAESGACVSGGPSPCGATWRARAEPSGKNLTRGEVGVTEAAQSGAQSYGVQSREAAAARGRGGGRGAHGAPRPRRQRAPTGPAALNAPRRSASNTRPGAMPVMKGLLAPQNTFLDTIATRFDGTREWGGGWG